jgi:hypothetical protein
LFSALLILKANNQLHHHFDSDRCDPAINTNGVQKRAISDADAVTKLPSRFSPTANVRTIPEILPKYELYPKAIVLTQSFI